MPVLLKVQKVFMIISTGIGNLLYALLIAGGFMLISKLIGAENNFKAIFCVTIYVAIAISIVSFALLMLVIRIKDPTDLSPLNIGSMLSSSLGAILEGLLGANALPKFLMKLANFVELFAIWHIVLLSIGYSAVSRKLKTATVATWLSVVYGIIALIGAAVMSTIS
jgi:hypothetical protein